MRSEWREVVVADICSYRQERVDVETLTESSYVSTANMVPNRGGIEIAEKLPNTTTTSRFISGDVLISNIRPYFKKSWLASKDGGCSNDVLVMQAKDGIDTSYLYYLLSSDDFFAYMTATSKGTKMPRGDKDAIMKYEVKIPPLAAQKIIAKTLSCLDAKIELNNKINENLEAQAQAIFKSWFVDFEPFQDGKFIESELGLIPEGWRVGKVGEYADLKSGFAFKSAWWVEEGVPVVRIGDIATNELRLEGAVRIGRDNVPQDETYHLRAGDFIIAMTGATIAKTALVPAIDELLLLNQRVGKFIPLSKNGFSLPFIFCFIRYPAIVDKIINLGSGSAQPNVSPSAIKSIPLILPPDKVLDDFNGICKPIFLKMLKAPIENRILSTVRDTLLPKLMSGEIEVPVD